MKGGRWAGRSLPPGGAEGDRDRAIAEELDFYLDMRAREIAEAEGVDQEEGLRRARERFGDRGRIERELGSIGARGVRRSGWRQRAESVLRDVRFAARGLARRPAFAATAIATLALGIGANTAIFGVADAVLLRQPAVRAPGELAMVYTTCRSGDPRCTSSWPDYVSYRERSTTLGDLAAYAAARASFSAGDGAEVLEAFLVSGNYFQLLGVPMALGRPIQPADAGDRGGEAVAVLSAGLWRDRFGADPGVLGRAIRLDGVTFTVVGVASAAFRGIDLGGPPDVYVPLPAALALWDGNGRDLSKLDSRSSRWIGRLVGRLAPGATAATARTELLGIADRLAAEYPGSNEGRSVTVDPVDGYVAPTSARGDMFGFVGLLAGVVGFTLLLACANLANLLLARATARRREMGIRLAVGAGAGRLVRQLLTESTLLAGLGGLVGLGVAWGLLRLLSAYALPGGIVIADLGATLDGRLLAFALLASVGTGILFGILPALEASRPGVISALKEGERGGSRGGPLRGVLVAVQVALCLVLLAGSGLFLRSLGSAMGADLGYDPRGVALATFDVRIAGYEGDAARSFADRFLERAAAVPEVDAAALAMRAPLDPGGFGTLVEVPGYETGPGEELRVEYNFVSPRFFDAAGATLVRGRGILPNDAEGSGYVAVINEAMAERWWPGRDAVGGTFRFGSREVRVVGIAREMEWFGLESEGTAFVTMPLAQGPAPQELTLLARARAGADAAPLLPSIRTTLHDLDREVPLLALGTLEEQLGQVLMPQRMGATLLTLFGGLALLLAGVGIWGVVSYTVSRSRREIGLRIALGAGRGSVLGTVTRGLLGPVSAGLVAGLAAALLLTRLLAAFIYGIRPDDPLTFAAITAVLLAVATLSAVLPARRATRVDPMTVLREE